MKFENLRIRKALGVGAALVFGLALSAALGLTGSAQATAHAAAVVVPAASSNCGAITDFRNNSPLFSYVPGNGNYNLYFDNSGTRTEFCMLRNTTTDEVQLYDMNGSEMCLALDEAAKDIHEATQAACAAQAAYTEWFPIAVETSTPPNGTVYNLMNEYMLPGGLPGGIKECLYDNTQRPAIYNDCSGSNQFEWMEWPPLPIHP